MSYLYEGVAAMKTGDRSINAVKKKDLKVLQHFNIQVCWNIKVIFLPVLFCL